MPEIFFKERREDEEAGLFSVNEQEAALGPALIQSPLIQSPLTQSPF